MISKLTSPGRPPRNSAILNHTNLLGGFEFLKADYSHQTFPSHSHEEYLIGVIERGVHDVWCQGEWWHAAENVVATLAPDEMHKGGEGDPTGWVQTIFYFPQALIATALDSNYSDKSLEYQFNQPFSHSPFLASHLLRLRTLIEAGADQLLIEQEAFQTIQLIFNRLSNTPAKPDKSGAKELSSIRDYIEDNISEAFDITTFANLVGLSKRQFIALFQRQFNMAPYQFVMLARVRRARDLLKSGATIANAAFGAGFGDQSHLTRNFRAIYGVTPARYKLKNM